MVFACWGTGSESGNDHLSDDYLSVEHWSQGVEGLLASAGSRDGIDVQMRATIDDE